MIRIAKFEVATAVLVKTLGFWDPSTRKWSPTCQSVVVHSSSFWP